MKVLYIHQYFNTPQDGGSLRSYYLAKSLVKNNEEVVMITAHNDSRRVVKMIEGIQVIYLPVRYSNLMSFTKRGISFITFMILATLESLRHRNIDCCYVMTTPLSTGMIALFNKWILCRPYIFEVGDLWPAVPIEMGLLQSRWKIKMLKWFEQLFYKQAAGLVGLSRPITKHLQDFAPKVPTQTIYNISNCEQFKPADKNDGLIKKFKVENKFVLSYTGSFGIANDFSQVVALAQAVADLPTQILMVGDGADKQKILNIIQEKEIKNIRVLDPMNTTEIQEIINISDAMLVSFAQYDTLHTGSPNKFFDALAAGKLVITNFSGWVGDLIEAEQCGFVAKTPEEFKTNISRFLNEKEKLKLYQTNARKLGEAKFDLHIQASLQRKFILDVIN